MGNESNTEKLAGIIVNQYKAGLIISGVTIAISGLVGIYNWAIVPLYNDYQTKKTIKKIKKDLGYSDEDIKNHLKDDVIIEDNIVYAPLPGYKLLTRREWKKLCGDYNVFDIDFDNEKLAKDEKGCTISIPKEEYEKYFSKEKETDI